MASATNAAKFTSIFCCFRLLLLLLLVVLVLLQLILLLLLPPPPPTAALPIANTRASNVKKCMKRNAHEEQLTHGTRKYVHAAAWPGSSNSAILLPHGRCRLSIVDPRGKNPSVRALRGKSSNSSQSHGQDRFHSSAHMGYSSMGVVTCLSGNHHT